MHQFTRGGDGNFFMLVKDLSLDLEPWTYSLQDMLEAGFSSQGLFWKLIWAFPIFSQLEWQQNKRNLTFSHWFQVQWDESTSITRPERVSPWEIEAYTTPVPTSLVQPVAPKSKRPRPSVNIPNLGELTFLLPLCLLSPYHLLTSSILYWAACVLEPACSTVSAVWNPSHEQTENGKNGNLLRMQNGYHHPQRTLSLNISCRSNRR